MKKNHKNYVTENEKKRLGESLGMVMEKSISLLSMIIGGMPDEDYEYFGRNSYFRGKLENPDIPCGGFIVYAGSLPAPRTIIVEGTDAYRERTLADCLDFISIDEFGREYLNRNIRFLSAIHAKWFFAGKRSGASSIRKVTDKTVLLSTVRNEFINPKGSNRDGQMFADDPYVIVNRKRA